MSAVSSIPATVNLAEHELVLGCIRPELASAVIREFASKELDWDYLFLFARRHGVTQLLYSRIQQAAPDLVPETQLIRLQKYFQANAARNVLMTAELCRLINSLAGINIEGIPYKGPVLGVFAYQDIALRRFVDLDIMVRREDALPAIKRFLAEGYEFSKPLTDSQLEVLLKTQHNVQFRRFNRQLIVELHWEVASHLFASSVQADELWRHLEVINLNGTALKTLAAEDLIFSLCVHGSRHLWERLLWICDVGWIMANRELRWTDLMERAKSTQAERMFLLGIALAQKLLGVNPPEFVARQISNDAQLDKLASVVIEGLFNGTVHRPASTSQIFRYNLMVRKSWPARFRYFRHMLNPTDRDLDTISLPGPLTFGYYLMRPIRLLFRTSDDVH
ncbi:MAG TPA: nucleotidyltransferase family protein [Pyrinomonadaceae bacterium]